MIERGLGKAFPEDQFLGEVRHWHEVSLAVSDVGTTPGGRCRSRSHSGSVFSILSVSGGACLLDVVMFGSFSVGGVGY